jgi:hypothetical protein
MHREPVMGLHYLPYRETCTRDFVSTRGGLCVFKSPHWLYLLVLFMDLKKLTDDERVFLENFLLEAQKKEMQQAQDLVQNCNNKFQFAKTYSVYVEDWEKMKKGMEEMVSKNILPSGISKELMGAMMEVSESIIQEKLDVLGVVFEKKFGESIFKYLRPDGKRKKFFGIF